MNRITKILVLLLFISVIFFTTACSIDDIKGSISDIIGGGDNNGNIGGNPTDNPTEPLVEYVEVILKYNDDKQIEDVLKVEKGEYLDLPSDLYKYGHFFVGWYSNLDGVIYTGEVKITSDVVFTAYYETERFVVTFVEIGTFGDFEHSYSVELDYGRKLSDFYPKHIDDTKYVFAGWYSDPNYNNRVEYVDAYDMTLYAKIELKGRVSYNTINGISNVTIQEDEKGFVLNFTCDSTWCGLKLFIDGCEINRDNVILGDNVTANYSDYLYWDLDTHSWFIRNELGSGATYTVIYDAYTNTLSCAFPNSGDDNIADKFYAKETYGFVTYTDKYASDGKIYLEFTIKNSVKINLFYKEIQLTPNNTNLGENFSSIYDIDKISWMPTDAWYIGEWYIHNDTGTEQNYTVCYDTKNNTLSAVLPEKEECKLTYEVYMNSADYIKDVITYQDGHKSVFEFKARSGAMFYLYYDSVEITEYNTYCVGIGENGSLLDYIAVWYVYTGSDDFKTVKVIYDPTKNELSAEMEEVACGLTYEITTGSISSGYYEYEYTNHSIISFSYSSDLGIKIYYDGKELTSSNVKTAIGISYGTQNISFSYSSSTGWYNTGNSYAGVLICYDKYTNTLTFNDSSYLVCIPEDNISSISYAWARGASYAYIAASDYYVSFRMFYAGELVTPDNVSLGTGVSGTPISNDYYYDSTTSLWHYANTIDDNRVFAITYDLMTHTLYKPTTTDELTYDSASGIKDVDIKLENTKWKMSFKTTERHSLFKLYWLYELRWDTVLLGENVTTYSSDGGMMFWEVASASWHIDNETDEEKEYVITYNLVDNSLSITIIDDSGFTYSAASGCTLNIRNIECTTIDEVHTLKFSLPPSTDTTLRLFYNGKELNQNNTKLEGLFGNSIYWCALNSWYTYNGKAEEEYYEITYNAYTNTLSGKAVEVIKYSTEGYIDSSESSFIDGKWVITFTTSSGWAGIKLIYGGQTLTDSNIVFGENVYNVIASQEGFSYSVAGGNWGVFNPEGVTNTYKLIYDPTTNTLSAEIPAAE